MWGQDAQRPGVDRLDQHRRGSAGRGTLRRRRRPADADRLLRRAQHLVGGLGGQDADDRRADASTPPTRSASASTAAGRAWTSIVRALAADGPDRRQRALAGAPVRAGRRREGPAQRGPRPHSGRHVTEYSKVTGTHLPAGSRIELRLSGGAGVGPASRAPGREAVLADVAAGYLSEERRPREVPARVRMSAPRALAGVRDPGRGDEHRRTVRRPRCWPTSAPR